MSGSEATENEDPGMTFWEHLDELRSRVFKIAVATVLGGAGAWYFKEKLFRWLATPFEEAWMAHFDTPVSFHILDPAAMFVAYLKLSFIGGVVFALPIIFFQVWSFVAPGLYAKEKRFAIPFVIASSLLFSTGAYFGMTIAFPTALKYLLGFAGPIEEGGILITPTITVSEYVTFISRLLLAFGFVFELPVVVFFLSVAGVVNHKHLIKFFRYFIVIAFVLGAVITPPDLMSQLLLAGPLCGLYVFSIGIAWVFGKKETVLPSAS